ncbi:MAG: lipoprotein [Rhizobacter sp.]
MKKQKFSVAGRSIRLIAVGSLLSVALLSGCGQKGPLSLPTPPASASAPR